MKRIVILGNSWHGNWSSSLFEELQKQNKQVISLNVLPYNFKIGIFFIDNLVRKLFLWVINKHVVRNIYTGDTVIVITPYTLSRKTFENLQKKNTCLIAWFGDDPFRKGDAKLYLPFFQKIFVVDRSWIEPIQKLNTNVVLLPHAYRDDVFFPINYTEKKYNISFVGDSFLGNSEGLYRAKILKALYDSKVNIGLFGDTGWLSLASKNPEYTFLKEIYQGPIRKPEDLNLLYNNSHIVLNIHHRQVKDGANQRVFEVSGSEAFQISDKQNLIQELFFDSIETYTNGDDLVKKVQYYLSHKEIAKQKAREARAFAKGHTYQQRISVLLHSK